jgi:hypothetical protein
MSNEHAQTQGIAFGVHAYNEARGSALSGPPDCGWCGRPKEPGHHGCYCEPDPPACEDCDGSGWSKEALDYCEACDGTGEEDR